jgi:hypothetical protein
MAIGKIEQLLVENLQDVREMVYEIRHQYCSDPSVSTGMMDESKLIKLPSDELIDRLKTIRNCTGRILDRLGE